MSTQLHTTATVNGNRHSSFARLMPALLVVVSASVTGPASAHAQTYSNQRVNASRFLPTNKQGSNHSSEKFRSAVVTNPAIHLDQRRGGNPRNGHPQAKNGQYLDQSKWRAPVNGSFPMKPAVQPTPVRNPGNSRYLDQSNWRNAATQQRFHETRSQTQPGTPQFSSAVLEDFRYRELHSGSTTHYNGAKSKATAGAGIDTRTDGKAGVWVEGRDRFAGVSGQARGGAFADGRASQTGRIGNTEVESFIEGEAFLGGQAGAQAGVSNNGARLGADAFVGARTGARGGTRIGNVEAAGTAEAWAGLGAEGKLNAGYKDGKLKIGGELGAALGVGGKLGGEVTIPVDKIGKGVESAAKDVGREAEKIGKGAEKVGQDIGKALGGLFK